MTDLERAELRALADQFREAMAREPAPVFDLPARVRTGEMIGKAARHGRSDYAYGSPR